MQFINLCQRTPKWHEYRKLGIGSSDIAAIVGCHPFNSASDIYLDKTNSECKENHVNVHMQRGIDNEEKALRKIETVLSINFKPINIEDSEKSYIRASLDGYNVEQNILVEIKIPSKKNYIEQCSKVIDYHYCQVQWQLMITKGQFAYLFIYNPEDDEGHIHIIDACPEYQKTLIEAATDFWINNVLTKMPPEKYHIIDDPEAVAIAQQLEHIITLKKNLEKEESIIKTKLRSYASEKSIKCENIIVRKCQGKTSYNIKMMQEDGIDLTPYEKKSADIWKVELKKL